MCAHPLHAAPILQSLAGLSCGSAHYKHAAPTELCAPICARYYKHGAPPELARGRFFSNFVRFMANTYSQIYVQIVFAPQGRQSLIGPERKEELQKYITGIVTRQGQKLIAIHCMADHTHILIGLKPNIALSDLVGDIKTGSTNHINEKRWVAGRFSWQEGFGAFSYSHSQLRGVSNYIRDQVRHHARRTFRQEYLQFPKKFEIEHDERYIFKPLEEK